MPPTAELAQHRDCKDPAVDCTQGAMPSAPGMSRHLKAATLVATLLTSMTSWIELHGQMRINALRDM